MRLTRREFIQASVASAAMLTAGCATQPGTPVTSAMSLRPAKAAGPAKGDWVASTCQGCTQWCAIQIFVEEGRAVRVRGNPLSKTNHGYVCPRGHLIPQQVYDPDRIKVPMKRTNPQKGRGVDPKCVPISWDEALDTVADKMIELRKNNEAHKLVYMRGRYSPTSTELLYGALPRIFGTTNYFSHSAICAEAEKMGSGLTQGFFGYRDYDLEKTNCLVIWGCDPLASNRMVPNTIHRFHEILARGTVVAVDPRLSNSAAKAQEWLPIKPGTDGALAGGHRPCAADRRAVEQGVRRRLQGRQEPVRRRQDRSTKPLSPKRKRRPRQVVEPGAQGQDPRVGGEGNADPGRADDPGRPRDGQGGAQVDRLDGPRRGDEPARHLHGDGGVCAQWPAGLDRRRGWRVAEQQRADRRVPEVRRLPRRGRKGRGKFKKLDGRGAKDMPAMMNARPGSGVVTNNVANGMLKDPGAVKVFIASWANFNFSCTGADRWDKAMAKVPFFVHLVTNPSEMTQFADIVLPATFNSAEGWSIVTNMGNGVGYASIQQGAVKRLWDVKQEETEVVWLLAEKLKAKGFPNLFDYYAKEFKDPETGKLPTNALEFSEVAAKISSASLWMPKEPLKGDAKLEGWADFRKKGIFSGAKYSLKKGWGGKFTTATKKFEFYSETLKKGLLEHAKKFDTTPDDILTVTGYVARGELAFVPHYEPPKRHGSVAEYPFDFIDYKSRLNREGRSANLTWYQEFKKVDPGDVSWDDVVKMNPTDGVKLGLKTGDMVKITSRPVRWS